MSPRHSPRQRSISPSRSPRNSRRSRRFSIHENLPDCDTCVIEQEDLKLDTSCLLGEGKYGIVVKGKYNTNTVAVKILSFDKMDKELVNNEIAALVRLGQHPNILRFYGVCKNLNHFCIVTEYMQGDLRNLIFEKKKKFTLHEKIVILQQIAYGMNFAHQKGVVHRDIKLENILIDEKNVVKIADFGLTEILDPGVVTPRTYAGTLMYMPPEVGLKREIKYPLKQDVYSFSILMYILLLEKNPFELFFQDEYETQVWELKKRPILTEKDLDKELIDLLIACWDPDPSLRPDFRTIAKRLESYEENCLNKKMESKETKEDASKEEVVITPIHPPSIQIKPEYTTKVTPRISTPISPVTNTPRTDDETKSTTEESSTPRSEDILTPRTKLETTQIQLTIQKLETIQIREYIQKHEQIEEKIQKMKNIQVREHIQKLENIQQHEEIQKPEKLEQKDDQKDQKDEQREKEKAAHMSVDDLRKEKLVSKLIRSWTNMGKR